MKDIRPAQVVAGGASCCFRIAGIDFEIAGDADLLLAVAANFRSFPAPAEAAEPPAGSCFIEWRGAEAAWRRSDDRSGTLRLTRESFRLGATQLLINDALAALVPGSIALHGNALAPRGRPGEALLLLGESGAGKTTLTRELLGMRPEAPKAEDPLVLLCEDLILLDSAEGAVWPYPRSAGVRDFAGPLGTARRTGFGEAAPPKAIVEYPAELRYAPVDRPVVMHRPTVFLLERGGKSANAAEAQSPDRTEAYLTWADDELVAKLGEAGLGRSNLEERGGIFRLAFEGVLDAAQLSSLASETGSAGAALLLVRDIADDGGESPGTEQDAARPPVPSIAALEPSAAVPRLLTQVRRGSVVGSGAPGAGMTMLSLSRFFAEARFFAFCPGGSPSESAGLLLESL